MHKQLVHLRLSRYISGLDFGKADVEDGYYRFMIQLKVENKNDLVRIKHSSFEKYLGEISDENIVEAEFTEVSKKATIRSIDNKVISYLEILGWSALIIYILRNIFYGL